MNDNDIDNFKRDLGQLHLTKMEKSLMHARMMEHLKESRTSDFVSPFVRFLHRSHWLGVYALVGLLVIIVPTAYAANQSLPGSPLYPIKVSLLEPIEEAAALTPDRRVAVTIENAENRVRETAVLLQNDKAESEDLALATANLSEKVARVRKDISAIDNKDVKKKIDLQKDLLTVLETYSAVVDETEVLNEASTTVDLEETADSVEDDIRDSIDTFASTAKPEEVSDEVVDTIAETKDALTKVADEKDSEVIDKDQRKVLEEGVLSAQKELSEADPSSALEALIFSDQDADVIGKLNEIQEQTGEPLEEATSSVATSSTILD